MSKLLKTITFYTFAILLMSSVSYSQDDPSSGMEKSMDNAKEEKSMEPVGVKTADGMLYGTEFDRSMKQLTIEELLKDPDALHNNEIVVRGVVVEVCQAMGCWMTMSDGTTTVRAKTGHNFFLPKDISGKEVIIIGTFNVSEISEDDAKHFNEESMNPKDEAEISGPQKEYGINADGILILDAAGDSN